MSESPAILINKHRSKSPTKASNRKSRSPTKSKSPLRILRDESIRLESGESLVVAAATTNMASDFYNVTNVRHVQQRPLIVDLKPPLAVQSSNNVPILSQQQQPMEEADNDVTKKRRKSIGSSSLEFLTSFFSGGAKSKSQSPARSKTPPPPPPPPLISKQQQQQQQQQQNTGSVLNALINPPYQVIQPSNTSDTFSVQDMIRNELKKIVQMQHDTVMGFLNGGVGVVNQTQSQMAINMPNKSHLEQQLTSILRQQQQQQSGGIGSQTPPPCEFIIETKIKTIDPKTGQPMIASTQSSTLKNPHAPKSETNYFMKTFHSPPRHDQEKTFSSHHHHNKRGSSRIKIPLLNLNRPADFDNDSSVNQPVLNLPLLDFKSKKTSSNMKQSDQPKHLLTLDDIKTDQKTKLNKHVKEFIQANKSLSIANYKQFPLLKLNFTEERQRPETNRNKIVFLF